MVVQLSQQQKDLLEKGDISFTYFPDQNETVYYKSLFQYADKSNNGTEIDTKDVISFLPLSNLPQHQIDIILKFSGADQTHTLNRKKFYVAVRLIQLEQNNVVANNLNLTVEKDVILEPAFFSGVSGLKVPLPSLMGGDITYSFMNLETCNRPPTPMPSDDDTYDTLYNSCGKEKIRDNNASFKFWQKFRHAENKSKRERPLTPITSDAVFNRSLGHFIKENGNENKLPLENWHTHHHIEYENQSTTDSLQQRQYHPCLCAQLKNNQDKNESKLAMMRNVLKENKIQMWRMEQDIKALRELVTQKNSTVNLSPQNCYKNKETKSQQLLFVNDNSKPTAGTVLPIDSPFTDIEFFPYDDDAISEIVMPVSRPKNIIKSMFKPFNNVRRSFSKGTNKRIITTNSVDSEDSLLERMHLKALCYDMPKDKTTYDSPSKRFHIKGIFGWWRRAEGDDSDYVNSSPASYKNLTDKGSPNEIFSITMPQTSNLDLDGKQTSNRTNVLKMNTIVDKKSAIKTSMPIVPLTSTLNRNDELLPIIKSNPAA